MNNSTQLNNYPALNRNARKHNVVANNKTASHIFMPQGFDHCSLSVARCELNKLTDCTSNGLCIGVSHIGGDIRNSHVTVHKSSADDSYSVAVLSHTISWDAPDAIGSFKKSILAVRKIINTHNKQRANAQEQVA